MQWWRQAEQYQPREDEKPETKGQLGGWKLKDHINEGMDAEVWESISRSYKRGGMVFKLSARCLMPTPTPSGWALISLFLKTDQPLWSACDDKMQQKWHSAFRGWVSAWSLSRDTSSGALSHHIRNWPPRSHRAGDHVEVAMFGEPPVFQPPVSWVFPAQLPGRWTSLQIRAPSFKRLRLKGGEAETDSLPPQPCPEGSFWA